MIEVPGYTILRLLGHGGMATVYLALQQSLRREVALKILLPALAQDHTATERFLREARVSAKLHHPHIVAIYDVGVYEGVPYMSIAYEPGGTVAQKIDSHGDSRFALRIIRDIASALDYAHNQGVIHRDVKPENILLRADGNCVLSDFGIAHAIGTQTGLTREGTSVGTPHYMSPEQLRGEQVDGRSDIYSLGVVFYQLLTGNLPYQGTDGWAIGLQHINAPVPKLPIEFAQLQTFLDVLLTKDPDARLQTGAEVAHWADARLSGQMPAMTVAMTTPAVGVHTSGNLRAPTASIALLPFADMSQSKDQEYLADGLSEELLNLLSKVSGLYVASRSSAASFKGKNAKLVDIGRELKVATVLEGSVRKFGERVRISVQLINVSDGFQMWSETYDRQLTDVFAVQDEIASLIAAALQEKLIPKPAPAPPAVDPELARQLQIGRERVLGESREDALVAVAAFGKVLAIAPHHSEAQAGSAAALQTLSRLDAAEAEAKAARERELAEKTAEQSRQREAAERAATEKAVAEKAAAEADAVATAEPQQALEPEVSDRIPRNAPERVRDPALEFATAYVSSAKTRPGSGTDAPPAVKPARKPGKLLPIGIGAAVVLALVAWQATSYFSRQRAQQCQTLLAQGRTAASAGDYTKAADIAGDATGYCTGDQLPPLQALNLQIQSERNKAQACASVEAQAVDLIGKSSATQARELLVGARENCGARPTYIPIEKQAAHAQSEANELIIRAGTRLQANALDDAMALIDQAMAKDADVPGAQKLLIKIAAKRGKLGSTPP